MAVLTPATKSGLNATLTLAAASAGGDVVTNTGGGVMLVLVNNAVSSQTVTIKSYADAPFPPGTAAVDVALVMTAGTTRIYGPLSAEAFNNGSSQVELTYSAVVTLLVGSYKSS